MTNLIDDVATLSTINKKQLVKFLDLIYYSINEAIEEDILDGESVSDIDIGIGELHISYVENELKFKFIPSQFLKTSIIDTIKGKQNNLEFVLDKNLIEKITKVYKEII